MNEKDSSIALACVLDAIPAGERAEHVKRAETVIRSITATRELDDGYAWTLPLDQLALVAEFVSRERLCCPFFRFEILVPPQAEAMELRLTGGEGVKGFIAQEFVIGL